MLLLMQILHALRSGALSTTPSALTIGTFDGVHLGHQMILRRLIHIAADNQLSSVVITFENHPREILNPTRRLETLTSTDQKIELLRQIGVDAVILLTFSPELRAVSAQDFLEAAQTTTPFSHMVLGYDSTFGKNREGNRETVPKLAKAKGFSVEYLDQCFINETAISSTMIRQLIRTGDLSHASQLLGRDYSLEGVVEKGAGKGALIGFPTANLSLPSRCLPPNGVYAISTFIDDRPYLGVANLGLAPTIQKRQHPILEVHLFDFNGSLYERKLEVALHEFIRPEKTFDSPKDLVAQIQQDIHRVKNTDTHPNS